jgi:Do/DeqQ family serine protease
MKHLSCLGLFLTLGIVTSCVRAEPAADTTFEFPLDQESVDRTNQAHLTSYADMLEPVRAAVVSVTSESIVRSYRQGNPMEEMLRRLYGMPNRSRQNNEEPEERRVPNGMGSGVIISADGYVLTNNHVVVDERGDSADTIIVQLNDEQEYEAELIGRDPRTDIALLKLDAEGLPFVPMADSDNLRVGDVVFAIGNPLGVGQTTTMGIVSATGRSNLGILGTGGYEDFIQTDAAINRGNSGGALVDAEGRLVGVNSAIISPIGANIGIGFAIPSRIARQVGQTLVRYGEIRRGFLGVSIRDLDEDLAAALGLDSTDGVLIERVQEDQPADKAGIERGDVIIAIAGEIVRNVSELRFQVASIEPGSEVEIDVLRDGKKRVFDVTLTSLEDPTGEYGGDAEGADILEGVTMVPNNEERAEEWELETEGGVVITSVDARSPYASALQRGMVILEVNRREVDSLNDVRRLLRSGSNLIWVSFRGSTGYISVRVP